VDKYYELSMCTACGEILDKVILTGCRKILSRIEILAVQSFRTSQKPAKPLIHMNILNFYELSTAPIKYCCFYTNY